MSLSHGFQRTIFSKSTAAQHLVVAAVAGKRIRLRGCILTAAGAVVATFETDSTTILPANLSASYSLVLPATGGGVGEEWVKTEVGEPLNITLGGAVAVDGVIFYDLV